jgi:energy-coupling factor transport system permease protein
MLVTWRYHKRKSFMQMFDPRAWLIFYACFMGTVLFFWDLRFLLVFDAIALLWVLTSGITWRETRRAWLFLGGFIILYSILTFLTGRGGMEVYQTEHTLYVLRARFSIFGWTPTLNITVERLFFALSQWARVFALASMTLLIPYGLDPSKYGIAFRGLGMPDKFAYAMDLTMRFIPTFARDFQLTLDAQRARGYELEKIKGGLVAQVRRLAPLMVPVTIHAIVGAEDIIDAMDLRAFGVKPRTWLQQLVYQRRDRILIALGVVMIAAAIIITLFGYGNFWVPPGLLR